MDLLSRAVPFRRRRPTGRATGPNGAGSTEPLTTDGLSGVQAGTVLLRSGSTLRPVGEVVDLDELTDRGDGPDLGGEDTLFSPPEAGPAAPAVPATPAEPTGTGRPGGPDRSGDPVDQGHRSGPPTAGPSAPDGELPTLPAATPPVPSGHAGGPGPAAVATLIADYTKRAVRRARAESGHLVRWCADRWRSSLQLRVASMTVLICGVVVLVVGMLLVGTITAGLLNARRTSAAIETKSGLAYAQEQLSVVTGEDDVARTLRSVVTSLAERGSNWIVVLPPGGDLQPVVSEDISARTTIPSSLSSLIAEGKIADAYARVRFDDGHSVKALIVGGPLAAEDASSGGTYQLYYLFPLQDEERTIALVRRTVVIIGILLVLLVAGIALLVTRQVVRPVRGAALTAERLAAGRLQERMDVRGRDEIAMLASAFNGMADSLQRQISQLEEMSRLQRRFTSDVSHELRTPLTTVRMAADVLHAARDAFAPEVARSAELLQNELDRFESLLADLLEISRFDAHVAVLEPDPVDLRALVLGAAEATSAIAEQQGSVVLVDLPPEPVVADVDARRVQRILRNLMVNAAEHGEGQPVEVCLRGDDDAVAVTVRDHGVGLRPGEAGLVFDRFWRADPSRDRRTGGTGLGLAISLEDARLHGGWLHAWGRPGLGAQFRLTLPTHSGGALVSSPLPIEPPDAVRRRRAIQTAPVPGEEQ